MKLLILGHGYMAKALATEAASRGWEVCGNVTPCERMSIIAMRELIHEQEPSVVFNCAAWIPPSGRVIHCDDDKSKSILGNAVFPQMAAEASARLGVPFAHLSTGCLYDEAREYEETDPPIRGWNDYCGTYVGCKLLAEKLVLEYPKSYVLRLRLPFDEIDHSRNYISKLASFPTVFDHWNSLTHRGDFAKAALDLFELDAAFGVYHVTNPGQISAGEIVIGMLRRGIIDRFPEIKESEAVKGTRLSTRKLLAAGVKIRPVEEAIEDSLDHWRKS